MGYIIAFNPCLSCEREDMCTMCELAMRRLGSIPSNKWVSVDERLPEKHGKYVVYRNLYPSGSSIVDIIAYDPDYDGHAMWYFFDNEWGDCEVSGVTHWMPLPEPPKMKGE